jgi:fructose-1,6-bisphosphatase I
MQMPTPQITTATNAATREDLDFYLGQWAGASAERTAVAEAVAALGHAGGEISRLIAAGPLAGAFGEEVGAINSDGDVQKNLDILADQMIVRALRKTSTAYYASEEEEAILTFDPAALLAVACDPVDGSSNIDSNQAIATIFAIFPASPQGATASFFRPGREQIAAGYIIYGPHTELILTLGDGTAQFALDPVSHKFVLVERRLQLPVSTREYAINASNYRHWPEAIRAFIDDCVEGASGPRGKDFNMRWLACMAGEAHRILMRGGVYLYPSDQRKGYEEGRLRLLYEAFPISFLIEQAGGAATDGDTLILDKSIERLHQRTPLIFGTAEKVERIASYFSGDYSRAERSPLFGHRGLFQA